MVFKRAFGAELNTSYLKQPVQLSRSLRTLAISGAISLRDAPEQCSAIYAG